MSSRRSRRLPRLGASRHVVAYWHQGRFVLHHVPTGRGRITHPLIAQILHFFQQPHTVAELLAQTATADRPAVRRAVAQLVKHTFLHRTDREPPAAERALDAWGEWNPAASFFHFSTRDMPWAQGEDRDALERAFRRQDQEATPPPPVKRHPGRPRIRLPSPRRSGEFADVLLDRRTWRGFGRRPLPLDALAELLRLTFGVQYWGDYGGRDRVALKTSPSGGARTSLEAYVLAVRVDGLARGLYHYVADRHELEVLRRGAAPAQIETYVGGQWYFRPAAALVLMTAVVPRLRWRYRQAEAYGSLLIEAGHFCQTFCLVATWLQLAPFCTVALAHSRIERDLGIDGVRETLLYAAGVGTRPADGKWVQWPAHLPGHPDLPPYWKTRRASAIGRRRRRPRPVR